MDTEKYEIEEEQFRRALEEGRKAGTRFFLAKFRKFGSGFLLASLAVAIFLEGMPLHCWWNIGGPVALLVWLGFFVMTTIYGSMALGTWLLSKGKQPTFRQSERNFRRRKSTTR